jgi:uncharacterized protein (DUF1330 family)
LKDVSPLHHNGRLEQERKGVDMPAYLVVRVRVSDPKAYEEYKKLAAASIEKHSGRYLARGGRTATLEGEEESGRVVVVEFPTFEKAEAWYRSPEYRKAIEARKGAATGQFVLVEGA